MTEPKFQLHNFYIFGPKKVNNSGYQLLIFGKKYLIPKFHFAFYKGSNLLVLGFNKKAYAIIVDKFRKYRTLKEFEPCNCDTCHVEGYDGDWCDYCSDAHSVCLCGDEAYEHQDNATRFGFCKKENCNCQKFRHFDSEEFLSYKLHQIKWKIKAYLKYKLHEPKVWKIKLFFRYTIYSKRIHIPLLWKFRKLKQILEAQS